MWAFMSLPLLQAQGHARKMWAQNVARNQEYGGKTLTQQGPMRPFFQNVSGQDTPPKSTSHLKKDIPKLRYRWADICLLVDALVGGHTQLML